MVALGLTSGSTSTSQARISRGVLKKKKTQLSRSRTGIKKKLMNRGRVCVKVGEHVGVAGGLRVNPTATNATTITATAVTTIIV